MDANGDGIADCEDVYGCDNVEACNSTVQLQSTMVLRTDEHVKNVWMMASVDIDTDRDGILIAMKGGNDAVACSYDVLATDNVVLVSTRPALLHQQQFLELRRNGHH